MFEIKRKRLERSLLHTEAFFLCLHRQAVMVSMKKEQKIGQMRLCGQASQQTKMFCLKAMMLQALLRQHQREVPLPS